MARCEGGVLVISIPNVTVSIEHCVYVHGSDTVIRSGLCSSPPFYSSIESQ